MTMTQQLYDNYLAVGLHRRKVNEKICDKQRSIRRIEKQIQRLEESKYADNWVNCLVEPLAQALLPLLGCEKYEVYGPFGLRAYVGIRFTKPAAKDKTDCYSLYLTLHCEYNDDNQYKGEYCSSTMKSVHLKYDTYKRTAEYPQGSIGWLNGFNTVEEPLPDTLEEIAEFIIKSKEENK